jgi:beta-galactosidase
MNLRYRPLLDGPLFGAFGSYGMDGSRTPRSTEASRIAKWANAPEQKSLWEARPVRGDIALLVIPEAQAWDYLLNHNHMPQLYREAMWGAYRGFLDNGLQPDWVHIDHIADYEAIYAPYPIMLTAEHAKALAAWVENGGTLISEATPGYFGDRGKVGTVQPHNGLDAVFGAREFDVEFMPDIGDRIRFDFDGAPVGGGGFLQSYTVTTGTGRGKFEDGRLAVVENTFGKGRTLLVGSHPGAGYFKSSSSENLDYFRAVFDWTGRDPNLVLDNTNVIARLHRGASGGAIYVLNPTRSAQEVKLTLGKPNQALALDGAYWGNVSSLDTMVVPPRDVVIVRLKERSNATSGR